MLAANVARPTQLELAVAGQAEFVICDQSIERSFGWMARFRRLARDYERLAETLVGLHFIAFAVLMAKQFIEFMVQSA